MTRVPRGTGILEVLVALPLVALLGVVAVQLLLSVHRQILRDDGALGATRELRHGAGLLTAELRVLRSRDVITWSDTSVEFDGTVGIGVGCQGDAGTSRVALIGTPSDVSPSDPLSTIWSQPPQAGDQMTVWLVGATPVDSLRAEDHTVQSVSSTTDCGDSPLRQVGAPSAVRLTLLASLSGPLAIGGPVRIARRTRYSLYRATDGDWFLGRRTRGPSGWDVIQPVAGPLSSARDRGLVIRLYDRDGERADSGIVRQPTRIELELRAPARAGRAAMSNVRVDSVRIVVGLRTERGGQP